MGGYHKAVPLTKTETPPAPPSRLFEIKVNGETRELKMSFALFQELMRVIPDPENIAGIVLQDFDLREYLVRRVLTGNKRVREDADLFDLFENEVDDDDLDDLVLWVVDHILHFFTTTAEKSKNIGLKYESRMKALTQSAPSQTGSPS